MINIKKITGDKEEKKAQDTAPLSLNVNRLTGSSGPIDVGSRLNAKTKEDPLFDVYSVLGSQPTQYNYDTYEKRAAGYKGTAEKQMDSLLPSSRNALTTLQNIYNAAGLLSKEGAATQKYAVSTGQKGLPRISIENSNELMKKAEERHNKLNSYKTDTDYLMGENRLNDFDQYRDWLEKQIAAGNKKDVEKMYYWGDKKRAADDIELQSKAVQQATDKELADLKAGAKTKGEVYVYETEQQRRNKEREDILMGLMDPEAQAYAERAAAAGAPVTADQMLQSIHYEMEDLDAILNDPTRSEHEKREAEARKQELDSGLKAYENKVAAGNQYGPEAPELYDWKQSIKNGTNGTYTERYEQENKITAMDWTAVSQGEYTGTDPQMLQQQEAILKAREELDAALNDLTMNVGIVSDTELAAYQQKADEAQTKLDALEAQAYGNAMSALDKNDAVKEAVFGTANLARIWWQSTKSGIANFITGVGTAAAQVIGKPLEMLDQLGYTTYQNLDQIVSGEKPSTSYSDAIVDTAKNGMMQKWIDDLRDIKDEAAYEAYKARMAYSDSKALEIAQNLYINFVEQVPEMTLALMGGLGAMAEADAVVKTRSAMMDAINELSLGGKPVERAVRNMIQMPGVWTTFAREYDDNLQKARESGAADPYAVLTATLESLIDGFLEMGPTGQSGWQGLMPDVEPAQTRNWLNIYGDNGNWMDDAYKKAFGRELGPRGKKMTSLIDSWTGEGMEEGTQNLNARGWNKARDVAAGEDSYSLLTTKRGGKALIDLPELGEDIGIGTLGGITTGSAMHATQSMAGAAARGQANVATGETIITNDMGKALGGIAEDAAGIKNDTTRGLIEGTLDLSKRSVKKAVGKLYNQLEDALSSKEFKALQQAIRGGIQNSLREMGYSSRNVEKDAAVMEKALSGGYESLSAQEKVRFDNPEFTLAYEKLTGDSSIQETIERGTQRLREKTQGALKALDVMLRQNRGKITADPAKLNEAAAAAKTLGENANVSDDGRIHINKAGIAINKAAAADAADESKQPAAAAEEAGTNVRDNARGRRTGTQQDLLAEQKADAERQAAEAQAKQREAEQRRKELEERAAKERLRAKDESLEEKERNRAEQEAERLTREAANAYLEEEEQKKKLEELNARRRQHEEEKAGELAQKVSEDETLPAAAEEEQQTEPETVEAAAETKEEQQTGTQAQAETEQQTGTQAQAETEQRTVTQTQAQQQTGTQTQAQQQTGTQQRTQAGTQPQQQTRQTGTQQRTGGNAGTPVEIIGPDTRGGQQNVRVRMADNSIVSVPYQDVSFATREQAQNVALAMAVGGEAANTIYNAKMPDSKVDFETYAREMVDAMAAGSAGLDAGTMQALGIGKNLQPDEINAAIAKSAEIEINDSMRDWLKGYLRREGKYAAEDINPVTDAVMAMRNGVVPTAEQQQVLEKYDIAYDIGRVNGLTTALYYGQAGLSMPDLIRQLNGAGIPMTDQIRAEYERGVRERGEQTESREREIREGRKRAKRGGYVKNITEEDAKKNGVKKVDAGKLNDKQKAAVKALRMLAKDLNLNIVLYESTVNDKGQRTGDNGWYDPNTDTIYVDMYAGQDGEQAILRTVSHELTHMIKEWSPKKYDILQDFLIETYYGKGEDVLTDLIQHQMDVAKQYGRSIDEPTAIEEVVCDACEMMLGDAETIRALAKRDRSLWQVIRDFLDRILQHIAKAMEGVDAHSKEAKTLMAVQEHYEQARQLWTDALNEAAGRRQTETRAKAPTLEELKAASKREPAVIRRVDRVNTEEEIRKSAREGKPDVVVDGEAQTVRMPQGTVVRRHSYRSWNDTERAAVRANLIKSGLYTTEQIDAWMHDIDSIAAIIGADRARLDYDADPLQHFMKPNNEYRVTIDASTLCAKRLLYQGTFNEIQRRLPNTAIRPGDLIELVNMMKDAGHVTPCSICYVESRRRNLGNYAEKWLQEYTGAYKPQLADLTTTDGLAKLRADHWQTYKDFIDAMNKKGTSNPKVVQTRTDYRGDLRTLKPADIAFINRIGGLRFQSFSDFETVHMIDLMQAVMDGAAMGLIAQAYTKVPEFAWVFGSTGMKINLSLIGAGTGVDANGNLVFSDSEGIDHNEAFRIREAYGKDVGTIIVGMNDAHILAAMADDRIDFIIPFHRSGWSKAERQRMRNLGEYFDYTMFQNERRFVRNADGSFDRQKNGKYKTERIAEGNFYPSDYWDSTKSGKENAEIYLRKCAEDGRVPKFARFLVDNGDGSFSLQPDGSTDGYWKTLIDYKMYDNQGNFAPQEAMQPTFNMEKAREVLAKYEGGANTLPVADDIVDQYVDWFKKEHPKKKYSARDAEYMDAVNRADMATAQRLVNEAAVASGAATNERGRPIKLYHGTKRHGFTEFNTDVIFTTNNNSVAAGYADFGQDRGTSNRTVPDDGTDETLIRNAKNVLGWNLHKLTYGEAERKHDDLLKVFSEQADRMNAIDSSYMPPAEIENDFWDVVGVFEGIRENDENLFDSDPSYRDSWWSQFAEDYHEKWSRLRDYYYEHRSEIERQGGKEYFDTMFRGYDYGDALIELDYSYRKLADISDKFVSGTGSITDRSTVQEAIDQNAGNGIYTGYGYLGNNPYEVDAKKAYWLNIEAPEIGTEKYSTDYIVKWAKDNGYTSVIIKNVMDPGVANAYGDDYVFFDSSQFKSNEPVTYDDAGNVIPLDERFNQGRNDIRYSSRIRAANGIEAGMTDAERYDCLKGKLIKIQDATRELNTEELGQFVHLNYKNASAPLAKLARRYGLIADYGQDTVMLRNNYLPNVPAKFSKGGLNESIHQQKDNLINMAALMPVFEETYRNAIPVLIQDNRYIYAVQNESDTNAFMYLIGGFNYNGKIIPVQFELKQDNNEKNNAVYVVATIKKDAITVAGPENSTPAATAPFDISIEELIKNVNGNEGRILANLPAQFLNDYQKEGKRKGLKEKGKHLREKAISAGRNVNAPVNMTVERIDAEIKNNGDRFSEDYSKAYMTYITPEEFLQLTAADSFREEMISNRSRVMNASEMRRNRETPFMRFDPETGEITGHEGRHRMQSMINSGVDRVAILMIPDGSEGRYNRQTIDTLNVTGQDFGKQHGKAPGNVTLNNLIPVNQKHRQELIDTFSESESWFKYSSRDQDYKTNRQLLAEALISVATNDSERRMLEEYQRIASQLDMNEHLIEDMNQKIRDTRWDEPNTEEERHLVEERNRLQREITEADRQLFNMERMAPMRRIASEQRKKAENDLQKAKEHMQRYRQGLLQREMIGRVERTSRRLAKWLTAPAGKSSQYVPESLRRPLGEMLMTIDKMSARRRAGGPMTEEDRRFANQLGQISAMLSQMERAQNGDTDNSIEAQYSMYLDLPKGFTETLNELVVRTQQRMSEAGSHSNMLDQMTVEELETLDNSLIAISSSITHINDFLSGSFAGTVSETAEQTIRDMRKLKPTERTRFGQKARDFIQWDNIMPAYAFDRLGESGKKIFQALRDGQSKLAMNARRIIDLSEKLYTTEEAQAWSKEIKEFTISDGEHTEKIRIPVTHIMSLFCLIQRAQAEGHLLGEGFRVADFKDGRETVHDKGHVIDLKLIEQMTDSLTERQKAVARNIQHTMSTVGSDWGNYVSMRRFGYRQFTEPNYFPIKTDSDLLPAKTDNSQGNELYKLLNMSMTKPLTQHANNRLMLENIFDVYAGHMSDMAQYNALALPVLDVVKWWNFKESTMGEEEGSTAKYTDGVRDNVRNAYGQSAIKYITEFLKDVNGGGMVGDTSTKLYQKMLGKYNRVAVAANLRVALLQPLAIIRAGVELPGTSLAGGTLKAIPHLRREVAEMQKHSGIAVWKDLGYREMNIGRSLKSQIQHMETWQDKVSDKSMALAGIMDNVTWGAMWMASKEYVNRTQPNLRKGSEEYFKAVTQKFEDVIYKTQVVDSPLTKSQLMRSQDFGNKMMSSFMSEPTTTFNTLMAAVDGIRMEMKKGKSFSEAWQAKGRNFGRTMMVFMIAALVNTAIEQAMTAYRDDDDYETYWEKFADGFWGTLVDNSNPLTLIPGVKQAWEQGGKRLLNMIPWVKENIGLDSFEDQNVLTEGINLAMDGIEKVIGGKGTVYGRAYTLAKGASMVSGLPISPMMREAQALWNNTVVRIKPEWRLETSATPNATGYDVLYKAYSEGDMERYEQTLARMEANAVSGDSIASGMASRIQKDYLAGGISEAEAESRLVELANKKPNDAYFKVQEWAAENGTDAEYNKFDKLKNAALTGEGFQEAKKELMDHGYTEKQVISKVNTLMAKAAADGEITDAQATAAMVKYGGIDKDDAYWKLQAAMYEPKDEDDSFKKYGALEDAVLSGKGYDAAKRELTAHGVTEKEVQSQVRSIITEQSIEHGMSDAQVISLLKKYGGMDDNQAWIRTQELLYQKKTGKSTTSDIAMVNYAIEKQQSTKEAVDALLAHGKSKGQICSSITSRWHDEYIELWKKDKKAAATLKGRLAVTYDYIGYPGVKKITQWEKDEEKGKK